MRINLPLLAIGLVTALPPPAFSAGLTISQYLHTSWTQEEGSALPPIQAIAQAADGYLWLGSGKGLIRFDGMRFVEWSPSSGPPLPSTDIRCLRPASRGGLWVGTFAGICRVDNGRVIRYPAADKLLCGLIISLLEDASGKLWILNACPGDIRLAVLSPDGSIRTFGTRDGLPSQMLRTLFEDSQGNLWIGTAGALCRWSPGTPAVCLNNRRYDVPSIAEANNGDLAFADGAEKRGFLFSNGEVRAAGPRIPDASFTPGAILTDADGNIWIGTAGQGLLRLRGNKVDHFTRADGLSSNFVTGITRDREGDIWVATARGVDRMRDPQVRLYSTLNGLSGDLVNAVSTARDGSVWIGTAGGGLDRLLGDRISRYSTSAGLPNATILSLFEDARHRLWVGTVAGLAVQSGERFVDVLTESGEHLKRVYNIGADASGTVWLVDNNRELFVIHGNIAVPVRAAGLDASDIYGLLVSRDGSVWLGRHGGGIMVLANGTIRHYDARDGLSAGPVRAFYEDPGGGIWAGTGTGLSIFRGSRWTSWTAAQDLPEGGVQSILEDEAGSVWLLTPAGLLRLSGEKLKAPAKSLAYLLYGRTEGLRLLNSGSMTNPRLARAPDGRLWICTEDGVAEIDPARLRTNAVSPAVAIEQLTVEGEPVDIGRPGEVSLRGHALQITYTGISLMVPERVRFRYRMDGVEHNWIDAGTRRNVTYVNLPPGHYRFQVIASNSDGLWNQSGASLPLYVEPYFYQTWWFALLCGTAIVLLMWFVHRLRIRSVVSHVQAIAAERTRVSRELHDSLLQGFAGVVYLLEAAARQFDSAPQTSRKRLEQALDQADQSLREARQMIVSMRIPALENNTLSKALRTTMEQIVSGMPVNLQFEVKGHERPGPYEVEANIFLIAREAVTNSVSHASPTRIRSELRYSNREVRLTVEDDGVGFDPETAVAKPGHFGFRGMRERARQIGGTFSAESAAGRGARIEVAVAWKK